MLRRLIITCSIALWQYPSIFLDNHSILQRNGRFRDQVVHQQRGRSTQAIGWDPTYPLSLLQYIDSKSGEHLTVYNPNDDSLVSDKIHAAGEADVDAAVAAAKVAFKGAWGRMDPVDRAKRMNQFADLIRQHAEEIATLETKAMGSAVATQTMGYQVGADLFAYYAGMADKIHGETTYPTSAGKYKITQREPIGVCSGIGAWNVSAVLFAWKAAVSNPPKFLCQTIWHADTCSP